MNIANLFDQLVSAIKNYFNWLILTIDDFLDELGL